MATLALAPFYWWPLGLVSCYLLLWLLQEASSHRSGMFLGWCYGVGLFGSGASWVYVSIHTYGNAPVALAVFLTAMFCGGLALLSGLMAWLYCRFLRGENLTSYLGFAALWVLFEWLRTWLLTGFPWLFLGYSALDSWLAGWAPVIGVFGMSFMFVASAVTLRAVIQHQSQNRILALGLALSCWPAGLALQSIDWVQPTDNSELGVAMVQANIPQELKWLPEHYQPTLDLYSNLTKPEIGTSLIIWPEAAIPNYFHRATPFLEPLGEQTAAAGTALITGIPHLSADGEGYHNSIVAMGTASGVYHKQRLVPFGEYVPLENWLRGLIAFFDLPMSHFSQGPEGQALLRVRDLLVAPFICYEIVYPELVRQQSTQADFLITISNDSWFGESLGPLQHLQMARMRALENGRYLLRGTNNGVSAIINERGHVKSQTPQFETTVLRGKVLSMSGRTPYNRSGNWPALLISALLLMIALWRNKAAE